jgi:hypothetical protein
MTKKLIMACMAMAALAAFALPASASATNEPDLTEGAVRVGVGNLVVGTSNSVEFQDTTTNALVSCTKGTLTGEVLVNAGGSLEIEILHSTFEGTGPKHADNSLPECTGVGNAAITVTNMNLCLRSTKGQVTDEFIVGANGCKNMALPRFVILSTPAGECEYETTKLVSGTFTTGGTVSTLTVSNTQAGSGAKRVRGGFLCPSSGMLKMSFELEKENSVKLQIS